MTMTLTMTLTRKVLTVGLALAINAAPLLAVAAPGGGPIVKAKPQVVRSVSHYAGDEIELDLFEARHQRAREMDAWVDQIADEVVAGWHARRRMSMLDLMAPREKGGKTLKVSPLDGAAEKADSERKLPEAAQGRSLAGSKVPVDELSLLEQAVRTRVTTIIADAPTDAELSPLSSSFPIADLGRALVGLMVLSAPAVGAADPWGEPCATAVLRDTDVSFESSVLRRSPLIDFFENVGRFNDREAMSEAVFALSRIQAGMRCLTGGDLSALETVYAQALAEIIIELREGGHDLAARAFWDQALPVTLIFFEGVKAYKKPATFALLRMPTDLWLGVSGGVSGEELPLTPFRNSLAHHLYCEAPSEALTLDRFGIWAPDWTDDGRLERVEGRFDGRTAWPCDILQRFTELDRLGEGDCPLLEMIESNMICRSPRTCAAKMRAQPLSGNPLSGSPGTRSFPGGSGAGSSLGGGPATFGGTRTPLVGTGSRPGSMGSRFSHFGIDRAGYSDEVCEAASGSGGGSAPDTCAGPPLRNSRGSFSPDPEMDALMQCTFDVLMDDSGRPPRPAPIAEINGAPSPLCEVAHESEDHDHEGDVDDDNDSSSSEDESPGSNGESSEQGRDAITGASEEVSDVLRGREFPADVARVVRASQQPDEDGNIPFRGIVNPDQPDQQYAIEGAAGRAAQGLRDGTIVVRNGTPTAHGGRVEGSHHLEPDGTSVITIDYDAIRANCAADSSSCPDGVEARVFDVLLHEVTHHILRDLARPSASLPESHHFFTPRGEELLGDLEYEDRFHHFITRLLHLQCSPEDPMCGSNCGMEDSVFTRMASCVERSRDRRGAVDPRCTVDLCGDEEDFLPAGLMSGSCFELRDVPGDNPICRMLTCGEEVTLSGPYAQCCGGGASAGRGHGDGSGSDPGCGPLEQPRPGEDCGDPSGPPPPGGGA